MDFQRTTFVESLHSKLKKQAFQAINEQEKFVALASTYLSDGLEEGECVELLMIDGLDRAGAESYTALAMSNESAKNMKGLNEYAFQFEDLDGKLWSSFDIGETIKASNSEEAWIKTEEMLFNQSDLETERVVSVTRIS